MAFLPSLRRLALVIFSPFLAFDEISEQPTWICAYFTIAFATAISAWYTTTVFQQTLFLVPGTLPDSQAAGVSSIEQAVRYASTAASFFVTLLSWSVSAFLLWLIIQIFEGLASFKSILSVVAHASVATLLHVVTGSIILFIRTQNGELAPEILQIRMGLDLFWKETTHPVLNVILADVNPFKVWYNFLLTLGIQRVCRFSWLRAGGIVGVFWLVTLALWAGFTFVLPS